MATPLLNPYVGGGKDSVGSGSSGTPVGAVTADNPQKGVKRSILGNPVGVPQQLPGFRGRVVDAGAPVKAPKLRNGNLNNTTSNIRVPYNRVAPLEFLSSYTGRLSPGDVAFVYKYAPGFLNSRPQATNATLGVNTTTRMIGLDGLNRLLMGSNPDGWRVGMNVMWLNRDAANPLAPTDVSKGSNTAEFKLSVLNDYRFDGIIISNDEPGTFTSSGARDNVLFNVAIQGPTECNNGFLAYQSVDTAEAPDMYNPLTGVTNARTVEAYARGSAESGAHLTGPHVPGRVGSPWLSSGKTDFVANFCGTYSMYPSQMFDRRVGSPWLSSGKTDFVANFCGTYSMYPSQMFDRRVETLNSLYLGLRAYELSTEAKMQVTDENGKKLFDNRLDAARECMVFFQYMPFSSRVAAVIDQVTDQHEADLQKAHKEANPSAPKLTVAEVRAAQADDERNNMGKGRAAAAKKVGSTKQRSSISDYNTPFDKCTYDPIRTDDLRNMVGAWHVGKVLDTKAARHDPYAGGPRDTAFTCIVDVGISWRSTLPPDPNQGSADEDVMDDTAPYYGATRNQKETQQLSYTLTNNAQPALRGVLGNEFGSKVDSKTYCSGGGKPSERSAARKARSDAYYATVRERSRAQEKMRADEKKRLEALKDWDKQRKLLEDDTLKELIAKAKINEDALTENPMTLVRGQMGSAGDISTDAVREAAATDQAWKDYVLAKTNKGEARKTYLQRVKAEISNKARWGAAARKKVRALVVAINDKINQLLEDEGKIRSLKGVSEEAKTAARGRYLGRSKLTVQALNDASLIVQGYLADGTIPVVLGEPTTDKTATPANALADAEDEVLDLINTLKVVTGDCAHMLKLCEMHEAVFVHFDTHSPQPAVAATSKAPAPTGAKARGRSKTPPKSRGTAPAAPTVTPTGARVPAAAAGMSSTPLVPTSSSPIVDAVTAAATAAANAVTSTLAPIAATPAGGASSSATPTAAAAAAPRRRAREGGESSTTNSVFETMFATSPTAASLEEPASPTPSNGSDGQAPGPRTFRRIQR